MTRIDPQVNELRVSDDQLEAILDLLDAGSSDQTNSQRRSARHPLRGVGLVVTIADPDHPTVSYHVKTRNVSQHGVAFLCNTPILPETRLRIQLPIGPNGSMVEKPAIVRRCQHVRGMIHEIGTEFGAFIEKKKPEKTDRIIR